jgi:hypothetical protein
VPFTLFFFFLIFLKILEGANCTMKWGHLWIRDTFNSFKRVSSFHKFRCTYTTANQGGHLVREFSSGMGIANWKISWNMPGSRGRIGPGGVQGQRPGRGTSPPEENKI